MYWDVFISHAWEDKKDIARPLAKALRRRGLRVWYDDFTLTLGDSLRRSIDRGLAESRYGVVILSPHFFAKEWPQKELDGLAAREVGSGKVILPVWHNVTWEDVRRSSPTLADKLAVSTAKGLDAVVEEILRALRVDLESESTRRDYGAGLSQLAAISDMRVTPPELEMILIPAGEFLMGTREEDVGAIVQQYNFRRTHIEREVSQHKVFVEEFEIAKYPVTNAEFQRFVEATGYRTQAERNGHGKIWTGSTWEQVEGADWRHPQGPDSSLEGRMDHPVVQVSWCDAVAYCEWLSEKTGKPYRLPTEAEWEKAARGTDGREFPWGDEWDESRCNTAQGGPGTTTPAGQYSSLGDSPYGVADMTGNVWEWCSSLYRDYPYDPNDGREDLDAEGPRVLRGGSWKDHRVGARCAYREKDPSDHIDDRIGFRCAKDSPRVDYDAGPSQLADIPSVHVTPAEPVHPAHHAPPQRAPVRIRRPVNWEKVGAIAGVIGLLIALVAWLVPNAADFLSAWLSETPAVTPTSSPTHTPVISTATPVPPTDTPAPIPPTPTPFPPTNTPTPSAPPGMVYVPGGTFRMGSTDAEIDEVLDQCKPERGSECQRLGFGNESPQYPVTLDGFWIDRTEVTNAEYALCVADGDCEESSYADDANYNGDNYPVVGVSWQDAAAYCAWAGGRLPTEAEWEYAARGAQGFVYPWGDRFDCSRGNFDDETQIDDYMAPGGEGCDGYVRTSPVASFPGGESWCGALDMAGNVWEWVGDWHGEYPDEAQMNPTGPTMGDYKVMRGGSWDNYQWFVRAAKRVVYLPDFHFVTVGFRCAKDYP